MLGIGEHRLAARWQLVNGRQGHVPMGSKRKSARDGGGCHGQHVRQRCVLVLQLCSLIYSESAKGKFVTKSMVMCLSHDCVNADMNQPFCNRLQNMPVNLRVQPPKNNMKVVWQLCYVMTDPI